jgi:outer membrane receptor protein involved in Fe transport
VVAGSYFSPAGGVIDNGGFGLPVVQQQNTGTGDIWGVELAATWNPSAQWKANLSYSYQDYDQGMIQASSTNLGGPPPHNLASARLSYMPVAGLSFNGEVYYTDADFLYDLSTGNSSVTPDYVRVNLGADWKASDNLELALEGLDLEGAHTETLQAYGISPVEVVPSFYAQATLRY